MDSKVVKINLNTVCGGSLPELFNRELENVVKNIKDTNTDEKAKRKIIIEFTLEPRLDTERSKVNVDLRVKSTVAPVKPVRTEMLVEGKEVYEQQLVPGSEEYANVSNIGK